MEPEYVVATWRKMEPGTREGLLVFTALVLVILLSVIWAVYFRKPRRRRHHRHHTQASTRVATELGTEQDPSSDKPRRMRRRRREHLAAWRADISRACGTETPQFAVNRELQPVIHQYQLPFSHFDELLQGVEMDLEIHRYSDYERLDVYCYRVASVVGLLSIQVF